MKDINWLIGQMDIETKKNTTFANGGWSERALYHLLKQYKDCLPNLDERFHKNFRQVDVTGSAHADMAIWCLLQESDLFWQLFGQAQAADESIPWENEVNDYSEQCTQ